MRLKSGTKLKHDSMTLTRRLTRRSMTTTIDDAHCDEPLMHAAVHDYDNDQNDDHGDGPMVMREMMRCR